jgi:hypothetical protein
MITMKAWLTIFFASSNEYLVIPSRNKNIVFLTTSTVSLNYGTEENPNIHVGDIVGESSKWIVKVHMYLNCRHSCLNA